MHSRPGVRPGLGARAVVVAGTAGGVGTTTVTALLAAWARDQDGVGLALRDHTGGSLADAGPGWSDEGPAELVDLGPHASGPGVVRLADPSTRLVVVSAATPLGCRLVGGCLLQVEDAYGAPGLARTAVVLVEAFGQRVPRRATTELAALGASGVVVLAADRALISPGPIDPGRLSDHSRATTDRLGRVLDLDRPVGAAVGVHAAW